MSEALLLDVGYVIVGPSWAALEAYDAATMAAVTDRAGREQWEDYLSGAIPADHYWDRAARARGLDGVPGLFRALTETVPDELFDPGAVALMDDARAAGRRVGALTNDAYSIVGKAFFAGRPEFARLDAFVDSTDVGARKPVPLTYLAAASALAVAPADVVFLDDTPECVEGARRVGMVGILVDPRDRAPAFDQARGLLHLPPRPRGGPASAGTAPTRRRSPRRRWPR